MKPFVGRRLRWVRWGLGTPLALGGAVFLVGHAWGFDHVRLGRPRNIGNPPPNLLVMGDPGGAGSYRFAVMGDPEHGMEVFERCLADAQARGVDFAVLCGDIVKAPNAATYDYFLSEFAEVGFRGQVFTVIGNHDCRRADDRLFRRNFGPPNYAFEFRGDLFVLIDNARGITEETNRFLETTLRERRPRARRAFVFAHCPFFPVARHGTRMESTPSAGFGRAERLFAEHRVDAVFAGHLHGYRKVVRDGVLHVVTGGVGGGLDEPEAFHHYVEVVVDDAGVRTEVVPLDPTSAVERIEQGLEELLVRHVFFTFWARPARYLLLLLLLLLAVPLWLLARRAGALPLAS